MKVIIHYPLSIIHYFAFLVLFVNAANGQRFDYKDRDQGDTVVVNKKTYTIHICKKKETVYSIAAKYHISVNDLDNANKDVINDLKKNTILLIPVSKKNEKEEVKEEAKAVSHKDAIYKIALVIPFNEDKNYTLDSTLAGGSSLNAELDRETIANLEFYEGILIAVDSLKKSGLKARITVIDAWDSSSVAKAKLSPEVKGADLLITNISQNYIALFNHYQVDGKPVIVSCGMNTSPSLKGDSTAFFTTPSSLLQCRMMGEYYATKDPSKSRFIIIKTAFSKEIERGNAFSNALVGTDDVTIDKVFMDTTLKSINTLNNFMIKGKNNIVFLPTTDEAYVSDIINILKRYSNEYEITLAGLPTWQYFQSVSPEDLRLLHTTIFSAINIIYESSVAEAFRKTFREKYFTEPSENAFAGYDAMLFFGQRALTSGLTFGSHEDKWFYTGLSTSYHFVKPPGGNGYENNYISILQFEDYSLLKVNR